MRPGARVLLGLCLLVAWGLTYDSWDGWPPRSFRSPPPCCEQLLTCAGLRAADYGAFYCSDSWKVRWPGFAKDGTAKCSEMKAYVYG